MPEPEQLELQPTAASGTEPDTGAAPASGATGDPKNVQLGSPTGGIQEHPTRQHMITYTLSETQLDFIESGGSRFTVLLAISAFMASAAVSGLLSGLTVKTDWTAAQYAAFAVAPLFALFFAVVCGVWAHSEHKSADTQKKLIKRRSFEPGILKTLKDLRDDEHV